ncbi:MAG: signal peptidase I [bacterium]|nr:signal peptidase I [bacterium]
MEPNEVKSEKQESFFKETLRFAIITLVIVVPIRLFIAEPFIVSGASMIPTFENGDYLIVDRLSYNLSEPKRGDVIIFRYPRDPSKYFIKRIVGLPLETVDVLETTVTIKNKEYPNGFKLDQSYVVNLKPEKFSSILSSDEYFVMGDNRPQSSDSRVWGTLPRKNIIGRAWLRLYPLNDIDFLPGNHRTN